MIDRFSDFLIRWLGGVPMEAYQTAVIEAQTRGKKDGCRKVLTEWNTWLGARIVRAQRQKQDYAALKRKQQQLSERLLGELTNV